MANHTITAALIASVAICQLGWAKICAANFKAGAQNDAPAQCTDNHGRRYRERLPDTGALRRLTANHGQLETDVPWAHQYDK